MEKTAFQWMIEPLRKYATFSGRARRAEYWWFYLFRLGLGLAAAILSSVFEDPNRPAFRPLVSILALVFIVPDIAVFVRRLHDCDKSGWWLASPVASLILVGLSVTLFENAGAHDVLGSVIGVIGLVLVTGSLIVLFVWACSQGTLGENRFGPDPLAGERT